MSWPNLRRLPLSAANRVEPPDLDPPDEDDQTPEEREANARAWDAHWADVADDRKSFYENDN
jgi:hypothetical protein